MTNFKEWIFTRYDLIKEAAKIIDINEVDKNPFEMSKIIKIVDHEIINMDELFKLIKIIQFLCTI
jgi:hypothetical protein